MTTRPTRSTGQRSTSPSLDPITRLLRGDGRPAARLPGDPHHRHQRQGLDGADDHPPADGPGPAGRHVHEPPPRARSTSASPATASRSTTSRSPSRSPRSPTSRALIGVRPSLLRGVHGGRLPMVRRHRRRRRRDRGRPARDVGRHQRRRRPGRRHHQHRDGPQRVRRADARRRRPREGRDHQARLGGDHRRDRPRPSSTCSARRPAATRLLPRRRLRDGRQPAGGRRSGRRHPHADDDLPRCVRAVARRPPGRQRVARADRRRGVLRRPAGRRGRRPRVRRRRDARALRGARLPAAGGRRRRPQPGRRRHVRPRCSSTTSTPMGGGS